LEATVPQAAMASAGASLLQPALSSWEVTCNRALGGDGDEGSAVPHVGSAVTRLSAPVTGP
jgi:hypothetical protein